MSYNRQIAQAASQQSNASAAQSWLGLGNQTANQIIDTLQSVRTTVLQGLNTGGDNAQSYSSMAEQVQGEMTQLVGLANTQYGSNADLRRDRRCEPALLEHRRLQRQLPGLHRRCRQRRPRRGHCAGRPDVRRRHLGCAEPLHDVCRTSSPTSRPALGPTSYAGLQSDLNDLDGNMSQAENAATTLGEATQQVSAASTAAQNTSTQLEKTLATTESADVPTVTAALQSDLTTYQAALYAVSQTVPETLAQFLK